MPNLICCVPHTLLATSKIEHSQSEEGARYLFAARASLPPWCRTTHSAGMPSKPASCGDSLHLVPPAVGPNLSMNDTNSTACPYSKLKPSWRERLQQPSKQHSMARMYLAASQAGQQIVVVLRVHTHTHMGVVLSSRTDHGRTACINACSFAVPTPGGGFCQGCWHSFWYNVATWTCAGGLFGDGGKGETYWATKGQRKTTFS